jgi:hypothetical protein
MKSYLVQESTYAAGCVFVRRETAGVALVVVVFMFLLVLEPMPVQAASTLVQQSRSECTSCLTLPVSFAANVASGNVIVVGVVTYDATVTSVIDSLSPPFTQAITSFNGGNGRAYICYATLSSSGPDTITVAFNPAASIGNVYTYEASGVTTSGAATASGSSPSQLSTSISTSSSVPFQIGAFLLGVTIIPDELFTPGAGFTLSPQFAGQDSAAQYSTSGVSSPTNFPASIATTWAEAGIALNPTPASPIPEYPLGLPILAILMVIGYGLVRRRTRNDDP